MDDDVFLEQDWVIWNSSLGVHDIVMIERIESTQNQKLAWLDEPYEFVGPLDFNTLAKDGKIAFAECFILSLEYWQRNRKELLRESLLHQAKMKEKIFKEQRYSKRKNEETEHRELLELPIDGLLNATQIKTAFKKLAKENHPDVGGKHEVFVRIRFARDSLLESLC